MLHGRRGREQIVRPLIEGVHRGQGVVRFDGGKVTVHQLLPGLSLFESRIIDVLGHVEITDRKLDLAGSAPKENGPHALLK